MSQPLHDMINVPDAEFGLGTIPSRITLSLPFSPAAQIDDRQYPLQSTQNQPTQGLSNFVDGSGSIFSQYLEMATEEDKTMTEDWKADADGILIFVRHYDIL